MKVSRLIQRSRAERSCRGYCGATVGLAWKHFSSSDGGLRKLDPLGFHVLFGVVSNMGAQIQNRSARASDTLAALKVRIGLAGRTSPTQARTSEVAFS